MDQFLINLGFTFAGSCNCNGTHNKKYKRGEWLIYITRTQFKIKRNGSTVKGYTNIEKLEEYLQAAIPQLFVGKQIQGDTGV